MDEQDRDLEAGQPSLKKQSEAQDNAPPRHSSSGSTIDVDDKVTVPGRPIHRYRNEKEIEKDIDESTAPEGASDDYDADEVDHGEPDIDYMDAGSAVPGRDLDRQLSKVRDLESLRRVESQHNSIHSKASRVLSRVSRRSRKSAKGDGLKRDPIPETNLDEGIVGWDGQDDPAMPLNLPQSKKWMLVGLLSAITLVTPFASSILSPGISSLMKEFGETDAIVGAMTVSIYLLGYVVGPMFLAPLSEVYGRRPILTVANVFFCTMQIGCALAPSITALIIFRFFSGVGGSGCLTLGGGLIGDIFRPEERGFAMGVWVIGPLFGPTIGPLIGGFLAENISWRWDFWIVLILAVTISIMIEIFNQETSHKILIEKKVARLKKELGREDLRSCYDAAGGPPKSLKANLASGLVRPIKMLLFSPVVLLLTIYISFTYGTLYLLFTTIPTVFEETYGFDIGLTGLVYLGLGSGTTIGWLIITLYSDKSVIKLSKKNDGVFEPEMRLWMSIWFSWLLPITFFWYGWSAEYKVQYMSSIIALAPFGVGIMGLFLPVTTYLVDCYPMYAASAVAANTELRSLVGAMLPLAGTPMYNTLGLGWGNSLLGFLCFLMIPLPIIFYRYGKQLRKMEKFKL
ncbi:unnamed protein product [Discula destructiva]